MLPDAFIDTIMDLELSPDTSDEELRKYAELIETRALLEYKVLLTDVFKYLCERRDKLFLMKCLTGDPT